MWTFKMVMLQEFSNEVVQMTLAKDDKMVQALLPEGLNESLCKGTCIERSVGSSLNAKSDFLQRRFE